MNMQADTSRLQAATGRALRIPIGEGLAGTVAWYRTRGT
jgi:nucleoside-diphosphate-sugar epimerase